MTRRLRRSLSRLAISLSLSCGLTAHAQPHARLLWVDPDRFASTPSCAKTLEIAGADITSIRNGTGLDGAVHFPGLPGLEFAVDARNDATGVLAVGRRVHAPSGRVSLTEVDLSFPCAGPAWTIARSYASGVQGPDGARVADGFQGNNWFASAHPVLSPCVDGSGQITKLALVYGADRELRFARMGDGPATGVFRATDGAAGAIAPVTENSTQYFDYYDAAGNVARFMGPTGTSATPAWHLISITDRSGAIASVQFAGGLPSVAIDSAGRTFTYSYATAGGLTRLASVVAQAATGAVVGRVEYAYAGANDTRGLPGDLISVRTRTPVSDQSHTIDRDWHYRYYTSTADAGRLLAKIGPEGARRAQEDLLDPSLAPAPYRDSAFTYDVSGRVATALVREMPIAILRLSYAQRPDVAGYEPGWRMATTVHIDTGGCNDLFETLYFDEAEQPLGRFAFDADPHSGTHIGDEGRGARVLAASWQERNADGVVIRLRDGANLSQYAHLATGGDVFISDSALGLVVDRTLVESGLYAGFEAQVARRVGDASNLSTMISTVTYAAVQAGEGGSVTAGYLVASPLIESTTQYPNHASPGETTTFAYTFHAENGLAIETLITTDPVIPVAANGDGSTVSVLRYFDMSGRQRFERTRSGRIHSWEHDPATGQLVRFVWDAAASQMDGLLPVGLTVTGLASELMRREWMYTYDSQGRQVTQTSPDGRTSLTRVSAMNDGRPLVYSLPRVEGLGGQAESFFGPVSFTKIDLEGRVLESVDIGPTLDRAATGNGYSVPLITARTTAEPRLWIHSAAISLVESIPSGFERSRLITREFDPSGTFRLSSRVYTRLEEVAPSPIPLIDRDTSTHPFDLTRYGYDCIGHALWTCKPDGTVYTAVRDPLGRTIEVWRGFADGEQDPVSPTQPHKLASLVYDGDNGTLQNRLTSLTLHPGGQENDRVTRYYYDALGDVVAVKNPVAPHAVYRRDMLGRVTRRSLFGGNGAFLDAPNLDATVDRIADRQLVNDTFFDPLGRVFRSTRYAISADGTSVPDRDLQTDLFYCMEGNLRLRAGATTTEFGYNRAGELCQVRELTSRPSTQQAISVQAFLESSFVVEDTRLLRDRASGRLIGDIRAIRDVGRSPYDSIRTIAGAPGVLIQESSVQWDEQGSQFTFSPPSLYSGGPGFDYRFSAHTFEYDALGRLAVSINHGDPRMDNTYAAISGGGMPELQAAALALAFIHSPDTDETPRAGVFAYDGLNRLLASVGADGTSRTFQYDALSRNVSSRGGTLNASSSPRCGGPNGLDVGMLVIDSCPTEAGNDIGYHHGKIIWLRTLLPGDPNFPDSVRTPEEHWLYDKDYGRFPSGTMPIPSLPSNLPPRPREPVACRAIVDEVPSAWQGLELASPDFREATRFYHNALGESIALGSTGGTAFSIQRDQRGRPVAIDPYVQSAFGSGPSHIVDAPGSYGLRWEYDGAGRVCRVIQVQPGTSTPILATENTFGSLGELLRQRTTDSINPDPAWLGIGPFPTAQISHSYFFPVQTQLDALRRLGLEGTVFPGGLGIKIDFENSPEDQSLGRPRRATFGTWTDGQFTPPTIGGEPIDSQYWRGAYHGTWHPAWDELPNHPLVDEVRAIRDFGPALGMALLESPPIPGTNRFAELARDWIHQPICGGINCDYPGTSADPLLTPFGNNDTITRGRDGTSRTIISGVPNSRDVTYQPLTCNDPFAPVPEMADPDIFNGPIGTLIVRRGGVVPPSQADPVRVEHLVRDSSGGLLKRVVEQDTGDGREVLSVYQAVLSSSNRLVAYATKTPTENSRWVQMPPDLDPVADQTIIVRPEYDLRGNLIQDRDRLGRPRRFTYDVANRLTAVHIDFGAGQGESHVADWRILSMYRYDAIGRRVAAILNRNNTTTLNDDFVEFYGYDQIWRLTTVWRQAAADASGDRPAPVIYERFLHNPGWGSGGGRLNAPLMSQVNDNWDQIDAFGDPLPPVWDGPGSHRRTFIQDAFGNVIAVRDNTLERTTVRISYSPTGEPILDSHYSGADFDRNGGVDAGDLAAFLVAFQEGDETADMDQNGGVDGGDIDLFLQWHQAGFMGDHTLDAQRFLYRGYHWDDTLRMYHVRHRVYDPARMLWVQRDPLGRIPGASEYAYCLGEPIDIYDPTRLDGWLLGSLARDVGLPEVGECPEDAVDGVAELTSYWGERP